MKKMILGLAACGLILSSCSSNDVFEDNQGTNNPNVINFSATTTRATVNNLGNVKGGFPVYAEWKGKTDGWHIAGTTYKFDTNSWGWDPTASAPQWPAVSSDKQIHFYAYYPATGTGFTPTATAPTTTEAGKLTGSFTINGTAATQIDFLAANTSGIERIPQGGSVPLAFKHITTKINFGINAETGTKAYIQQLNINNVKNTGNYNYVSESWGTSSMSDTKPVYMYSDSVVANSVKRVVAFKGDGSAKNFYPCTPEGEVNSDKTQATDKHLMLLPQKETVVWAPVVETTAQSISPAEAYIGSVYRMTDGINGNEKDLVGYTNASSHPNYIGSTTAEASYNGPLFVKVGFPLNTGFSWTMGKAYTYNIMLGQNGATGGYILDDRYYDEKGNPTDLTINGKKPGEPVSGGTINFDVTVGNWDEQTATPIQ